MKTNWLMLLLTGILLTLGSGCTLLMIGGAAAAGAGGYAYVNGEAKSTEAASLNKAWTATKAAMKDLGFSVSAETKDALEAHLTARNAGDKKISIHLKKVEEASTEIRIRVGTFGDETLSRQISDKIKQRL